uniref:GP4 protein n=1 Tax=Free State vervet virus TaxID=1737586 RepID=A0A159D6P2_9NIDO|nr:GP4 protein [Free State vervet virus]
MGKPQILLCQLFTAFIVATGSTTTSPSAAIGGGFTQRHHVCVPCSATPLHNVSQLSFTRNESVYSGGCATQIYAGTTKFSETALFSTDAFSVLHLLECITEALATNGTFFCKDKSDDKAVACNDSNNHTVIAFCHNTTSVVEHPAPLAAISWAAALYTAITLVGIFTLTYV